MDEFKEAMVRLGAILDLYRALGSRDGMVESEISDHLNRSIDSGCILPAVSHPWSLAGIGPDVDEATREISTAYLTASNCMMGVAISELLHVRKAIAVGSF